MNQNFTIDCTGDACQGDTILFTESVFSGSFRNPCFIGERTITALIVKDSYGKDKQQHTFTLKIIACEGVEPLEVGSTTRRKGRNVYRNGTKRLAWEQESDRQVALNDKHCRGDRARQARAKRQGWEA